MLGVRISLKDSFGSKVVYMMESTNSFSDIDIAFTQLEFAIRLLSFCELEKINPASFDIPHLTKLDEGDLHFSSGKFATNNDLIRAASISVSLAFAATALTLDEALTAKGIKTDTCSIDKTGQIRILVYMVRCAFAHGISDPRWEVRNGYRRNIEIQLSKGNYIRLDLTQLHNQAFVFSNLGGHKNWFMLKEEVKKILQ